MGKRFAAFAAAAAIGAGTVFCTGAAPASAASVEGYCRIAAHVGDACFYYLDIPSSASSSMVGVMNSEITDVMSPWISFQSAGAGRGLGIGNAAGSERNGDTYNFLLIFEHRNFGGRHDYLYPGIWIGHAAQSNGKAVTINNERSYYFTA